MSLQFFIFSNKIITVTSNSELTIFQTQQRQIIEHDNDKDMHNLYDFYK